MPVATVRTTVAIPLALPGVELGDRLEAAAGVVVGVVAGRRCVGAGAEVPTDDADVVGVVRFAPVAEPAPTPPLVETEHPATVTSPSDSNAAAADPACRPIEHLRVCRRAPTLRSLPVERVGPKRRGGGPGLRPKASRATRDRCMLVWKSQHDSRGR
jgi:hypothetical protein